MKIYTFEDLNGPVDYTYGNFVKNLVKALMHIDPDKDHYDLSLPMNTTSKINYKNFRLDESFFDRRGTKCICGNHIQKRYKIIHIKSCADSKYEIGAYIGSRCYYNFYSGAKRDIRQADRIFKINNGLLVECSCGCGKSVRNDILEKYKDIDKKYQQCCLNRNFNVCNNCKKYILYDCACNCLICGVHIGKTDNYCEICNFDIGRERNIANILNIKNAECADILKKIEELQDIVSNFEYHTKNFDYLHKYLRELFEKYKCDLGELEKGISYLEKHLEFIKLDIDDISKNGCDSFCICGRKIKNISSEQKKYMNDEYQFCCLTRMYDMCDDCDKFIDYNCSCTCQRCDSNIKKVGRDYCTMCLHEIEKEIEKKRQIEKEKQKITNVLKMKTTERDKILRIIKGFDHAIKNHNKYKKNRKYGNTKGRFLFTKYSGNLRLLKKDRYIYQQKLESVISDIDEISKTGTKLFCIDCGKRVQEKYKRCYNCNNKNKKKCKMCGKIMDKQYDQCFRCYKQNYIMDAFDVFDVSDIFE